MICWVIFFFMVKEFLFIFIFVVFVDGEMEVFMVEVILKEIGCVILFVCLLNEIGLNVVVYIIDFLGLLVFIFGFI